jgi:hypothetical protein
MGEGKGGGFASSKQEEKVSPNSELWYIIGNSINPLERTVLYSTLSIRK